jgi:carboxypeptidase family protein
VLCGGGQNSVRVALLAWFFALLASSQLANAQVTGSISGRVEDATGAVVSGAKITVKSLETEAARVATTDAAGNFRIPSLPLGRQEVKAEKIGFKAGVRTGIGSFIGC